jgi:acyl-coenzyme A synthetase/AMP-(fatty) acid ligase
MDTIVSRLLHFAESQPEAVAFVEKGQRLTYGGLGRRVRATAAWLHRTGVQAGDVVALSFEPPLTASLRSLPFFYALASLGAVVLPLYPEVPAAERRDLVARFGARWRIGRTAREAAAGCTPIDPEGCDWRACERDGLIAPRGDDPKQSFLLQFSGGTTGTPKVVLFDHRQFLANMLVRWVELGVTAADRLVSSRPWPTLPGLRYLLRIHAIGGAFVNTHAPETFEDLERLITESGATILVASPWQLRRVLSSDPPKRRRAPELNVLYVAGAFIAPHEIEAVRDAITRNTYVSYACTEVGLISLLGPADPVGPAGRVGRVVPGLRAHAVDDDHRPLAPGTVGRLGFRAPWIPDAYVANEKASAQYFHDGWFYPGDVGAVDAEGWLSLHGRSDDVINFGGVKLQPEAIEAVLAEHPDVEDAAVVGVPHPMAGGVPVALVVLRRTVAPETLMTLCQSRIDASRLPVAIVPVPRIIRSPDGKILRGRLLDEYKLSATLPR